ncbi:hypothetical protein MLGJGCBP_02585 [Rhodococcus sp. T7]|nr:hypothetical protein MLGJGCBP_02585 [Rhodococcus sp. T7]
MSPAMYAALPSLLMTTRSLSSPKSVLLSHQAPSSGKRLPESFSVWTAFSTAPDSNSEFSWK